MRKSGTRRWNPEPSFMNVHQVAEYLQLNEKKVYALVNDGSIPATKATGKWLFPRELVDRWLLDSSHDGVLNDRLLIAGGDDLLLGRTVNRIANQHAAHALVSYTPTSTRLGLELLQAGQVDVCAVHWGPDTEADIRHPALLKLHSRHGRWITVRGYRREQGLLLGRDTAVADAAVDALVRGGSRWAMRQNGSGTRRFVLDALHRHEVSEDDLVAGVETLSEREAAAAVATGLADVAPGSRAVAREFGLAFVELGWERVDFVLDRRRWFRRLFQGLLESLSGVETRRDAAHFGGYDLDRCGELASGVE